MSNLLDLWGFTVTGDAKKKKKKSSRVVVINNSFNVRVRNVREKKSAWFLFDSWASYSGQLF